jgi:hypothetical protein
LELLVQLSFSEQIRNAMNETKEFDKILKKLANLDSSKLEDKEDQAIYMHVKSAIEMNIQSRYPNLHQYS